MKSWLKRVFGRSVGGIRESQTDFPSFSNPRSYSARDYYWGYALVLDEHDRWQGLVRVYGPDGYRLVVEFCPVRGEFVCAESANIPNLERARIEGRLQEHVAGGSEVWS